MEGEVINRHMQALGLQYRGGRHEATPAYIGGDVEIPGEGAEEAQGEGSTARQDDNPEPQAKPRFTSTQSTKA